MRIKIFSVADFQHGFRLPSRQSACFVCGIHCILRCDFTVWLWIFLCFCSGCRMQVPLLNALKTFTVSAQRLNFTKASEDLLVSPSAISHQIKILEEYLGCKLFLRKNRSLELTEEGLFLFKQIKQQKNHHQIIFDSQTPFPYSTRFTSWRISSVG